MSASDNNSYASDGQLSDGVGFNDAPLSMPITSTSSTDLSKTDLIHMRLPFSLCRLSADFTSGILSLSQDVKELQVENIYLKSPNPSGKSSKEKSSLTKEDEAIAYAGASAPPMLTLCALTTITTSNKCEMVIIAEASFVKHFKHRLDSERATSVSTARHIAGELFNINSSHFHSRSPCSGVTEVEVLLHDPTQPGQERLFKSRHFKSKLLANYLKAVLFGKSTLSGEALGKCPLKAILWGVSKTTPGMIAMAGHSGPSGINWKQHFIQYKYTILRLPLAYRSTLLLWYDNIIFPTSTMLDNTEVRVPGQSLISSPPALSNGQTPGVGTTMAPMPDPDPNTPVTEVTNNRAPRSKGEAAADANSTPHAASHRAFPSTHALLPTYAADTCSGDDPIPSAASSASPVPVAVPPRLQSRPLLPLFAPFITATSSAPATIALATSSPIATVPISAQPAPTPSASSITLSAATVASVMPATDFASASVLASLALSQFSPPSQSQPPAIRPLVLPAVSIAPALDQSAATAAAS
ncbi:hypothetical protein F5148DRAFT_1283077 [Russula earlei]|uniref:Uncharacterized protein n=1 Tax=Russula earlei TaxID=71964 RepID=A0ACC0UDH2_9AGAM|nr:hypothetical protein F5148DRAFT_1283077 [Russula earlei]